MGTAALTTAGCVVGAVSGVSVVSVPPGGERAEAGVLLLGARAEAEAAVRRAVSGHPRLRLASKDTGSFRLHLEAAEVEAAPESFSEPAIRAATYRARVVLRATLEVRGASSTALFAEAERPVVAPPGGVEALDGVLRDAVRRAAHRAADRLVSQVARRIGSEPGRQR